jgi:hypothetical protein
LRSRIAECVEDADYAERAFSGFRGFSEISGSADAQIDAPVYELYELTEEQGLDKMEETQ